MKYRPTTTPQRVCALLRILFAIFLFLYLYFMQGDLFALLQHRLSQGRTSYHDLIGAILLTSLLMSVQSLVQFLFRFPPAAIVLSFVPPTLLAVFPTAFLPYGSGSTLAVCLFLFLLWLAAALWTRRQGMFLPAETPPSLSVTLTRQFACLLPLLVFLGVAGNATDILHYELRTARLARNGQFHEALAVGQRSLSASPRLTALRAYALSRDASSLGERLFQYPIPPGGSANLLLRPSDSLLTLLPPDSLYQQLHLRPYEGEPAQLYFEHAATRRPSSAASDYWLCALLLDRNIDRFARELPRFYAVSDSLPLPHYYAEAMTLYCRLRTRPVTTYHNAVVKANYLDFLELGRKYQGQRERSNQLRRVYGDTYWWYYFYGPGASASSAR